MPTRSAMPILVGILCSPPTLAAENPDRTFATSPVLPAAGFGAVPQP